MLNQATDLNVLITVQPEIMLALASFSRDAQMQTHPLITPECQSKVKTYLSVNTFCVYMVTDYFLLMLETDACVYLYTSPKVSVPLTAVSMTCNGLVKKEPFRK